MRPASVELWRVIRAWMFVAVMFGAFAVLEAVVLGWWVTLGFLAFSEALAVGSLILAGRTVRRLT